VVTTVVPLEVTTSRTDLMLVVIERRDGISLRLEYDSRLYEPGDVAGLLGTYIACLAGAVAEPERSASQLRDARHGDRFAGTLREVFEEVLGVPVPSLGEDFFALGGDSLSSIRAVARARRRGLVFTPQQLFEHRTIARLARVVVERVATSDEQGPVLGAVEFTPIQRILLEADLPDLHHFNMATMLLVDPRPEPALLAIAVEHLLRHHDALRLRFRRDDEGWQQVIAGFEGAVPFASADLSALDDAQAAVAIAERAAHEQTTLDLTNGPILRVVAFDLGVDRPSRVLIVVHHLACDAVSWPILVEDLVTLYGQLQRGDAIELPAKSTSFQRWAERLSAWGRADARAEDRAFWQRECAAPGSRLPRLQTRMTAAIADVERLAHGLEPAATATVLEALAVQGVSVEAAGLVGLVTATTEVAGDDGLLVYLERHGRDVLPEIDVTRTVGWFTAVFPVRLPVAVTKQPEDTLALLVRHLKEIPHGGAGFGVVRTDLDANWYRPEVSFNYLGHLSAPGAAGWRSAPEAPGREVGRRGTRPTILDVTAQVVDGQLSVLWDYDRTLLARTIVDRLADRWMTVFCGLAGRTPTRRS
ncbi:MAG: condensation domain-containing protein, partial [Candidatus Binatia bacterium]